MRGVRERSQSAADLVAESSRPIPALSGILAGRKRSAGISPGTLPPGSSVVDELAVPKKAVSMSPRGSSDLRSMGPELFMGLGRRGFEWRICDALGDREIDRSFFSYAIQPPPKAVAGTTGYERKRLRNRSGTVRDAFSSFSGLLPEPGASGGSGATVERSAATSSIPTLTSSDKLSSPSGSAKIDPDAMELSPDAKILIIYFHLDSASFAGSGRLRGSLLVLDDSENIIESLSLNDISDVYAEDPEGDNGAFYVVTRETPIRKVRIQLLNSRCLDPVLNLTHQLMDIIDTMSEKEKVVLPDNILSEMICVHSGELSLESSSINAKFALLAPGRLLLFKTKTCSKPVFVLHLDLDAVKIDIKDSKSFNVIGDFFGTIELKSKSEVLRNLWLSAIDFDAHLRDTPSPLKATTAGKRKSLTTGEEDDKSLREQLKDLRFMGDEKDSFDKDEPTAPSFDITAELDDFMSTIDMDQENAALKGDDAKKFCSKLRNQNFFYHFFYKHIRKQAVLRKVDIMSMDEWNVLSEQPFFGKGKIAKSIDDALSQYHSIAEKSLLFFEQCLILSKERRNVASSSSQISFSYPGFETTTFNVGVYAVVDVAKMLENPAKKTCLTKDQWKDSLRAGNSIGKELMQSTVDVGPMIRDGHTRIAKDVTIEATEECLRNLYVAHYCWGHVARIRMGLLKSFSLDEMIKFVAPDNGNSTRLARLGSTEHFLNPSINEVYQYFAFKRKYLLKKAAFICTPLHWLHLLRFVIAERFGKARQIEAAVLTWKLRDEKKWTQKGMAEGVTNLLESVRAEQKNLSALLQILPSLSAMHDAMKLEVSRIANMSFRSDSTLDIGPVETAVAPIPGADDDMSKSESTYALEDSKDEDKKDSILESRKRSGAAFLATALEAEEYEPSVSDAEGSIADLELSVSGDLLVEDKEKDKDRIDKALRRMAKEGPTELDETKMEIERASFVVKKS